MGFHHRKLLHPYLGSGGATMACGTNCSPIASPLHSPVSLPLPLPWLPRLRDGDSDHIDHNYVLQVILIVIACMVGLVMFLFTMSSLIRNYYSRRYYLSRRNSPVLFDVNGDSPFSDDEGPAIDRHPIWFIPTVGLQQSIIDSITVCKYRKEEGLIDGTECSVCLGEFQEDESLRLLPKCSHAFHIPCIDTWLRSHQNCPLCRALIVGHTGCGAETVSATEPDSNFSGQNRDTQIENLDGGGGNHHLGESESSGLRVGDDDSGRLSSEDGGDNEIPDKILPDPDKINCHSPIPTVTAVTGQEFGEEIQPMTSDSVASSSASMISSDGVDLNSDLESSDTHLDNEEVSSSKDIAIAEQQGSGSSTIYKLASIGLAWQKRRFSMGRSSSHNRKFKFSRRCRSQSLSLPL